MNTTKRIIELIGGPADGVQLVAPDCYPCAECSGVVLVRGPETVGESMAYRGRPTDYSKADFLPEGWEGAAQ